VLLSVHSGSKRKYAHTLEMIQSEAGGAWVGVHSALANRLAAALLERHAVPGLPAYTAVTPEVKLAPYLNGRAAVVSAAVCADAAAGGAAQAAAVSGGLTRLTDAHVAPAVLNEACTWLRNDLADM
jgi:hypothetical protein